MPNPILTSPVVELHWGILLWPKWTLPSKHQVQWNDERSRNTDVQWMPRIRYMEGTWQVGFILFLFWNSDLRLLSGKMEESGIMKLLPHLKIKDIFSAFFIKGLSTESWGARTQEVFHIRVQMGVSLPGTSQSSACCHLCDLDKQVNIWASASLPLKWK